MIRPVQRSKFRVQRSTFASFRPPPSANWDHVLAPKRAMDISRGQTSQRVPPPVSATSDNSPRTGRWIYPNRPTARRKFQQNHETDEKHEKRLNCDPPGSAFKVQSSEFSVQRSHLSDLRPRSPRHQPIRPGRGDGSIRIDRQLGENLSKPRKRRKT